MGIIGQDRMAKENPGWAAEQIRGELMFAGAERVHSISGKAAHSDTDLMPTTVAEQRNLVPA